MPGADAAWTGVGENSGMFIDLLAHPISI
jgi:hypothetical protein